ncbi:MAG: exodeoxyribonuclease VII large subunit [Bacteroidota bacterium]
MTRRLQLSELVAMVQESIEDRFYNDSFWITAEITDVKKYDSKRWCFLKFIEKQGKQIATEMQGVFWSNGFQQILLFEKITRQQFKDGMEISCRVQVKFHPRYGLKLEVLEIDTSFALGKIEMERQQTIDRLLKENAAAIQLIDDEYITFNKQLKLPAVIQRVALITAPNSDGQRDFKTELTGNAYGYDFKITEFLTQLQGDNAASLVLQQLRDIYYRSSDFDVVVIVRGGGSQTDFKSFDNYELCRQVALFSLPVFTGIGHDRNTSITDLMARQFKTPTKVAAAITDINFRFENEIQQLAERLEDTVASLLLDHQYQLSRWQEKLDTVVPQKIEITKNKLSEWKVKLDSGVIRMVSQQKEKLWQSNESLQKCANQFLVKKRDRFAASVRLLHQLSPQTILNRGFAMVTFSSKVITDATLLEKDQQIKTVLRNSSFESIITQINIDDQPDI